MSEENKYYVPEMSEFHPGFEFEYLSTDCNYHKCILGTNDIDNPELRQYKDDLMKIAHAITRVKFLDKEDIESLEWEHDQTTKDGAVFYTGSLLTEKMWCLTAENALLRKGNDYTLISICDLHKKSENSFRGIVKNKSQLNKLMTQLGI